MPKIDAAPLDPLIIEEIKKREREKEQPQVPLDMPEYDPEEKEIWEEERRKKENPGNVEKINLV